MISDSSVATCADDLSVGLEAVASVVSATVSEVVEVTLSSDFSSLLALSVECSVSASLLFVVVLAVLTCSVSTFDLANSDCSFENLG